MVDGFVVSFSISITTYITSIMILLIRFATDCLQICVASVKSLEGEAESMDFTDPKNRKQSEKNT